MSFKKDPKIREINQFTVVASMVLHNVLVVFKMGWNPFCNQTSAFIRLEIKPCGFFETWSLKATTYLIYGENLFLLVSRTGTAGWTKRWIKLPKFALATMFFTFWPLTAFITLKVKNSRAHVTSHSAYVPTSTELHRVRIDGFLYPNLM